MQQYGMNGRMPMDNTFVVPNMNEVMDFADRCGIDREKAQEFYDHYSGNDWRTKGGERLTSWEGVLVKWARRSAQYGCGQENVRRFPARETSIQSANDILSENERLKTENERLKSAYEHARKERDELRERLGKLKLILEDI